MGHIGSNFRKPGQIVEKAYKQSRGHKFEEDGGRTGGEDGEDLFVEITKNLWRREVRLGVEMVKM